MMKRTLFVTLSEAKGFARAQVRHLHSLRRPPGQVCVRCKCAALRSK